jgi:hypothetical protein
LLIIPLPVAEEAVVVEALAEEAVVVVALAEEAVVVVVSVEAEEEVLAAFVIQAGVPVRFKAVNPAAVQVDLEEAAKVPLGVQVVGVLEAGNLVVVVLAVFATLAEVPVHSRVVKPAAVQVSLEEVVKAEISETEE